jgi:hypothetical protein
MTDQKPAGYAVEPPLAFGAVAPARDDVEADPPGPPDPPAPSGKAAVFVVHGMGGQLQFQTLTDVADGLGQASARSGGTPSSVTARAVGIDEDRVQRLEMTRTRGETRRAVHIYEGYWAPLTEGEVTLRDVIRFLFKAGFDALWHSGMPFMRYLDQEYVSLPVPVRTPLYLLTALLVTLSLIVMNFAIVGLSALRTPLKVGATWATSSLFRDVTVILDVFVLAAVVFGGTLLLSIQLRRRMKARRTAAAARVDESLPVPLRIAGAMSILLFIVLLMVTVAAGVAVPLVIYFHVTRAASPVDAAASILELAFGAGLIAVVLEVAGWLLVALSIVALAAAGMRVARMAVSGLLDLFRQSGNTKQFWLSTSVLCATGAVIAAAIWAAWRLMQQVHPAAFSAALVVGPWGQTLVWLLAIGVSAVARRFLVAYVGDVAAYIQPQELDRFNRLRERVKECVWKSALAVFLSSERYDEVVIVGHSLGSAIAYDTLNRLYREEQLGVVPGVQARSKLFVTFGSPLDKIAFLFAMQGSNREGLDALAASIQPLIAFPAIRPRWVNLYSNWDIISGGLDFYDKTPDSPHHVENVSDPDACVWLAAHTEYWDGRLVFDTIHEHLIR